MSLEVPKYHSLEYMALAPDGLGVTRMPAPSASAIPEEAACTTLPAPLQAALLLSIGALDRHTHRVVSFAHWYRRRPNIHQHGSLGQRSSLMEGGVRHDAGTGCGQRQSPACLSAAARLHEHSHVSLLTSAPAHALQQAGLLLRSNTLCMLSTQAPAAQLHCTAVRQSPRDKPASHMQAGRTSGARGGRPGGRACAVGPASGWGSHHLLHAAAGAGGL